MHISFWSHSRNSTFQKGHIPKQAYSKKDKFQREDIPKRASYFEHIFITCKKEHIPKRACSIKNTFKKEQSPKKAHSILITFHFYHITITHIPKLAHSKDGKFQKKAHYILITFKKYHIPKRAHSKKNNSILIASYFEHIRFWQKSV